uniref:Transcription factor domain-containing protein n=1 Tax=Mycena chlorophos TaxID=658473 RepID=A0ABQ0LBN7_MYCCL|nr:predicted protein [Mycena chlorophos]
MENLVRDGEFSAAARLCFDCGSPACSAEKNILCTTTPVARGRPRKHQQLLTRQDSASSSATASTSSTTSSPSPTPAPLASNALHPSSGALFFSNINPPGPGAIPDLNPEFVRHCFDALKHAPQYAHPLLGPSKTNIRATLSEAGWDIHRLTPSARVMVLCVVCAGTLVSYHPSIFSGAQYGHDSQPTETPTSFVDEVFFSGGPDNPQGGFGDGCVRGHISRCGTRRAATYHLLHDWTLRAAWEAGVLLQPTEENAASCYFLDMFEQIDSVRSTRAWAVAYASHIRVLAPVWHASSGFTATESAEWAEFLMVESLISARNRSPMLVTANDQLLLAGPEPPPLDAQLSSLQKAAQNLSVIWTSTRPFMYHVVTLARQLSETITGDYPRLERLSEAAVLNFINALTLMQSIVLILLEKIDAALISAGPGVGMGVPPPPTVLDNTSVDGTARAAGHALTFGLAGLVLPLYHELRHRDTTDTASSSLNDAHNNTRLNLSLTFSHERTRSRFRLMHAQVHEMAVHEMAVSTARVFVRGLAYLPRVHYAPMHWASVCTWAEFCVAEAEVKEEVAEDEMNDLYTLCHELRLLAYSLDTETSTHMQIRSLLDRMQMLALRHTVGDAPWMPDM